MLSWCWAFAYCLLGSPEPYACLFLFLIILLLFLLAYSFVLWTLHWTVLTGFWTFPDRALDLWSSQHAAAGWRSSSLCYFPVNRQRLWMAATIWTEKIPFLNSSVAYQKALFKWFGHPAVGQSLGDCLLELCQGNRSATDFALKIQTLAARLDWMSSCL